MDQTGEGKREEPLWKLFQREFLPPSGQVWASRKRSFQQHRQPPLPTPRERKHRLCSVPDLKPVKVRPHSNNETLVFSLPSKHSLFLSYSPPQHFGLHPLHLIDCQILQCLSPTSISSPSPPHHPSCLSAGSDAHQLLPRGILLTCPLCPVHVLLH